MYRVKTGAVGLVAGVGLIIAVDACSSDDPAPAPLPVGDLSDPAVFEAAMRQTFLAGAQGVIDAVGRVVVAVGGGAADGVVLTPIANGVAAAVSVDFNGDGTRESTINASLTGDINVAAQLTIASISAPQVPSLSASGGTAVTQTSPGVILADGLFGSGSADPPGSGNAADVAISDGSISLDLVTGNPSGFVDFSISGEGGSLSATATFVPDGVGGFAVVFSGPGIDFTIP